MQRLTIHESTPKYEEGDDVKAMVEEDQKRVRRDFQVAEADHRNGQWHYRLYKSGTQTLQGGGDGGWFRQSELSTK